MTPKVQLRVYAGLAIVWILLTVQAGAYAIAEGMRISIAGAGLMLIVLVALIAMSVRARRLQREIEK